MMRIYSRRGGAFRPTELEIVAKDGHRVALEVNSRLTYEDGKPVGVQGIARDITARKRAEAERRVISEIVQGIITTTNLDELLRLTHRSIGGLLYAENCFVALHDPATDLMHFEFWVDQLDSVPAPLPAARGFSGYVLRTGRPLLLTEELQNRMCGSGEVEKVGSFSASWVGVPLRTPSGVRAGRVGRSTQPALLTRHSLKETKTASNN